MARVETTGGHIQLAYEPRGNNEGDGDCDDDDGARAEKFFTSVSADLT